MIYALALAAALAPTEADLLRGIHWVESRNGTNAVDGDQHKPICQRSVGEYQVRPIAVRELVRVGRLNAKAIKGFSLSNCTAIRKWLAVPRNNRVAAREYLRLMFVRNRGVEAAVCAYNGSRAPCVYAEKVLKIAREK